MTSKNNDYHVENIVLSGRFIVDHDMKLDKQDLSTKIENAHVAKKSFPALICKDGTNSVATMLLFESAKFVLTGVKNVAAGIRFISWMRESLVNALVPVIDVEYRVVNIVGTGMLDADIDLDKIIITLDMSQYEPEVFPGLIYKTKEATFLLFKNGKFVFTGVKEESHINDIVGVMKETIRSNNLFIEPLARV